MHGLRLRCWRGIKGGYLVQKSGGPVTLGDELNNESRRSLINFVPFLTTPPAIGLLAWWASQSLDIGIAAGVLCAVIFLLLIPKITARPHFLLSDDKQDFMASLKLSDKTAIFDGSNIYHFGLDNGRGPKVLTALIHQLREEGYRVVCFFDANIYYTLEDNGEFKRGSSRFFLKILQTIFGLEVREIFIVPRGVQADKYIVESLSHLPISFAVTNDRFRDYEKAYDFLAKDNQWRKGVQIKQGNLLLYQHKFTPPLKI